jgi:uncharacterized protein (PEP-CTERM system associated)
MCGLKRATGLGRSSGRAARRFSHRAVLSFACVAGLSMSAIAQEVAPEQTMDVAGRRAWLIVPRVSLQETFTDNANLVAGNRQSDWITDVAPGIRIDGRTKRLKLNADYSVHQFFYAQGSRADQTQQSLNSKGTLEAVENLLFVDMSGSIMQQSVSAFGTQSASAYSANSNSTETSIYQVSPYVKGKFAGYVDYEGRYSRTTMSSKASTVPRSDSDVWSGKLGGDTPLTALGWSADADRQSTDYQVGRSNESEHWRGFLIYRVNPQLNVSVSGGQERNNYVSTDLQSFNTHGFGVDWRPTDRTQVSGFKEKRFFGDGHTVTFSHRMPQSSVKYTDSRDVMVLPTQSGTTFMTAFDQLFAIFATSIPDEAARTVAINNVLAALQIAPNTFLPASLQMGQASVQRRQELSYVLLGARNSMTLSLIRTRSEGLGTLVLDGFDLSRTTSYTQQGVNLGWSHQLSGLSTLNVVGSQSRYTSGNDLNGQTTQKALSASVSTRLGAKTSGSVLARRTVFGGSGGLAVPYTENAVSGSVSVEF